MNKVTQRDLDFLFGLKSISTMLTNKDLRGLDFRRADLSNVNMSGSDARGANFMGCKLPKDEWLPEMYLSDTWGATYYGSDEAAQEAWEKAS